jgi:prepilin signal peptidase PulO-like enzyme (type II secretory pathway)
MSCKTQLTWKELIPVCSFLFQKGKCKTCKTKLSLQYPLVELSTGILFTLNLWYWLSKALSFPHLIISVGITTCILALMIVIFVYDVRHKIIPDLFSFTAWGLSVVFVVMQLMLNIIPTNIGAFLYVLTGLFFYFIIWSIWKVSKGRMIGLGDAKLLLSIGTLLGLVYGTSAIFISVWIGTLYALYILLKQYLSKRGKHITMKTEIPFGPFLIIGFLIVYFFRIDVTSISLILENFS